MCQNIRAKTSADERPEPVPPTPVFEAAELIDRYPNLSEVELTRLINLYRHLSALDVALMISDASLGPKLDRFSGDHRQKIRTPFRQYAVLVWIAVVGVAMTAWTLAIGS